MELGFTTYDVFTSQAFRGNPLAIVDMPQGTVLSQEQKQLIAREFNLSETVFLHEQDENDLVQGDVRINIFTPYAEVCFAGHPTIGTASHLLRSLKLSTASALQTKAGRIPISISNTADLVQLAVAHDVHIHNNPFADRDFGHYPVVSIVKGMTFILAELQDLADLAKPTENLLGAGNSYKFYNSLDDGWREGLIASYFYVDLGLDDSGTRQLRTRTLSMREDPATGSAASALCSYLSLSESSSTLCRRFRITQGVEMGRKSEVQVEVTLAAGEGRIESVILSGTAVKIMHGSVLIDTLNSP